MTMRTGPVGVRSGSHAGLHAGPNAGPHAAPQDAFWSLKASLAVGALRVGEAAQEGPHVDTVGWHESSFELRQGLVVVELGLEVPADPPRGGPAP